MKGIKVLKKTSKKGVYCSGGMGGSDYFEFEIGKNIWKKLLKMRIKIDCE